MRGILIAAFACIVTLNGLAADGAMARADVPRDFPGVPWTSCAVRLPEKLGPRVCNAKGDALFWFETRWGHGPAASARKVRARVTPDGLAFDLREAFAAGARYIRLRTRALPLADFARRDFGAVAELTGSTGACAQVSVAPLGAYARGGHWIPKGIMWGQTPRDGAISECFVAIPSYSAPGLGVCPQTIWTMECNLYGVKGSPIFLTGRAYTAPADGHPTLNLRARAKNEGDGLRQTCERSRNFFGLTPKTDVNVRQKYWGDEKPQR